MDEPVHLMRKKRKTPFRTGRPGENRFCGLPQRGTDSIAGVKRIAEGHEGTEGTVGRNRPGRRSAGGRGLAVADHVRARGL